MSAPEGVTFHKGRFVAQLSLGTDPATGKRTRRQFTADPCANHLATGSVQTCRGCQQEARDLRAEKLSELRGNTYVEASKMTLGAWLEAWLEVHAARVRKSTLNGYRRKVGSVIVPRIGHVPIQQVDAALLEGFYARLLAGDDLRPQGYKIASVRQAHAILSRALRDAVKPRGQYLLYNPASEAELPQTADAEYADEVGEELRTWTLDELEVFLAAVRDHEDHAFFFTAAVTGMRRSELCGLRWSAVDLSRQYVLVKMARHLVEGEEVWATPKSKRSRRRVDVSASQTGVLREHRKAQTELRLKAGSAWADHDLVFCAEDGTPKSPDHYTRTFERIVAKLDLPRITLHDLRHTHATLLLEAAVPVKVVSERLGHSTTAFTMDTYMHVTEAMRDTAAGVLDGLGG